MTPSLSARFHFDAGFDFVRQFARHFPARWPRRALDSRIRPARVAPHPRLLICCLSALFACCSPKVSITASDIWSLGSAPSLSWPKGLAAAKLLLRVRLCGCPSVAIC
jgi:hypothetical protein